MKIILGLITSLVLLTQIGCSSKQEANNSDKILRVAKEDSAPSFAPMQDQRRTANNSGDDQPAQSEGLLANGNPSPPPAAPPASTIAPAAAARLLIYHANVRLKTTAMPRATARLDSLVRRSSGYLSAATETHADGEWQQETTIRVPPANFQTLLNGLAGLGTVEKKELSTNDVTAEHADVAARLQTKRAIEKQYTNLLNKAQKIKDILDIEEKLGGVREDIEATESRLKTLNSEVAYSTITLTLYQPMAQVVPDAPIVSLGSRVVEAFYGGWQLLTSLLVGAIALWPLLLLGAGSWWLWQRQRARRPLGAPSAPPAAE